MVGQGKPAGLVYHAADGHSHRYGGNLVKRVQNAQSDTFEWDAFSRMTRATTRYGITTFAYDPLGRRIAKHSQAMEGTARLQATRTMYGWDGDTLALESSVHQGREVRARTVHYVYERDSFVPLVQATQSQALPLASTTDMKTLIAGNEGKYDIALDSLWNGGCEQECEMFGRGQIAFYQCDHLGTPQELTDHEGNVAWSAQYKVWGQAKAAMSEAASRAGMRNPIRFQGQYFDEETGFHYNRMRYYDPYSGRFVSKDPIGLAGGDNLFGYAPNPVAWIDPLGLRCDSPAEKLRRKLSALGNAQKSAERTRVLPDGRVRYYEKEALARNVGPTRGRSHVTEWNPATGQVRIWEETYNHAGEVNRVHPKMNDGEVLDLPHYPPTKADIDQKKSTAGGRAIKCS